MTAKDDRPKARWGLSIFLLLLFVIGTFFSVKMIAKLKPVAVKKEMEPKVVWVNTQRAQLGTHRLQVLGMGEVKAHRQIAIRPQVQGEIIKVSEDIEIGVEVRKGQILCQLDDRDYQFQRAQDLAQVESMRQQLLEERGRQALAKQEWEALGTADASELQKALSLREPHLKKAEAALAAAISKLEHSDLQVQRCTVHAPFDGILVDWKGHLGSQAHGQFDLGMLLDHRRFNVEVQLKKSQLHLLPSVKNIPVEFVPEKKREMKKKETEKEMVSDKQWMPKGSLKSILPLHHEKGRLITALVSIENPLDSEASPLFVGDFIEARMDSLPFYNSAILPRSALGRGNHLWILNSDNSITKRDVRYSPKGDDEILVHDGLKEGEVYLEEWPEVSVAGMLVRPMSSNDSNVEK